MNEAMIETVGDFENDSSFGVCPVCQQTDGYINVGKEHWFICKAHKKKWLFGINILSSWKQETPERQAAQQAALKLDEFEIVEPASGAKR